MGRIYTEVKSGRAGKFVSQKEEQEGQFVTCCEEV